MTAVADTPHKTKRGPFARSLALAKLQLATKAEGDQPLPAGICGRLQGVCLVYDQPDDYDTMFAPGCMDRTKGAKVPAGKIKLFAALDGGFHQYGTRSHVGVVRALTTVGNQEIMAADLFDTAEGRAMKEYLSAVLAAGGETGLSIGFYPRADESVPEPGDMSGDMVCRYTEIELDEISITPINAVTGADVLAVRAKKDPAALERAVAAMWPLLPEEARARIAGTAQPEPEAQDTKTGPVLATKEQRLAAYRSIAA